MNMKTIKMDGCASTVAVMEYIRDNGIPAGETLYFVFPKYNQYLCASNEYAEDIYATLELHPVETWHDVFGMKRLCLSSNSWYAYINDRFYFISC